MVEGIGFENRQGMNSPAKVQIFLAPPILFNIFLIFWEVSYEAGFINVFLVFDDF